MLEKYINLLIIFGIIFLGIIGTFAENNESSSDIQIRKKRVINPAGVHYSLIPISEAKYVVSIQRRGSRHCVGSILMPDVIITVAHCVEHEVIDYQVLSGSKILGLGVPHNVSHKIVHEHYNPRTFEDDIALLVIHPLILNNPNSQPIQVYPGIVQPRQTGSIVAWGCPVHLGNFSPNQNLLQRIRVPLIRFDRCSSTYRHMFHISEKNICTLDTIGNKRCGVGDFGAPLVVNHQLIGMYIWSGTILGEVDKPDVFVYLNHIDYREWIASKIHGIGLQLGSRSH